MAQAAAQSCLLGDDASAHAQFEKAKRAHRSAYAASGMGAPDAFPARLVMGAYRHVLSEDEQERLRGMLDRQAGPL